MLGVASAVWTTSPIPVITIRLTAHGELVSHRGRRIKDGVAISQLNLLDLLLLHEPLDTEVVFR